MPESLLATKLFVPSISLELVPRPRLYERLDQGLTRKLTLVSAPAGFGKSTVVTGWLAENGDQAAWLSLDEGDNDPVRFWTYLIAAIQTICPELGVEARQVISAPQLRNNEPVGISLINDIFQLDHDLILVLDDYHVIEAEAIHTGLGYLLEHQPPNLHIVLITRADPSISLARLRAHSQLVEIRAKDLQFSLDEAATLLNDKMGLGLNLKQIEALNAHTESWVVGLQLAALSMKGKTSYDAFIKEFTGGHKFILDYLIEEVLVTLPEKQHEFMLRTSILDRFCSELCQAVIGDSASRMILDEIWKSNLFLIPLDIEGNWFRYHHLFAEVLNALLEKDHPDEVDRLHKKAAVWFDSEGYPDEAVEHALRSGDMDLAREMVLKNWMQVLHRGGVATVLRWVDALPEDEDGFDPEVPLARCWALFISGMNTAVEPHLEQATNAYERLVGNGSLSGQQKNLIASQLAMMRSVLARSQGDHHRSMAYAEEAAELIPREIKIGIGTAWNMIAAAYAGAGDFDGTIEAYGRGISLSEAEGNLIAAYGCTYGQAMYLLIQGKLNEAEELCLSTIERAEREGQGGFPAAGSLHMAMARIVLEQNRMDDAMAYLNTGLRIARPGGFVEAVRTGRYVRAQLAVESGDLDAAVATLEDTERIINAMDDSYLTGELNKEWAWLYLKAGDLNAARERLLILKEKSAATRHANLLLWERSLFPMLLCAEERYEEALTALDESIHHSRALNSSGELIRLLVLQAVALDALGDTRSAHTALHEALALSASQGYIKRWLDAGPGIVPLLHDLKGDRDTDDALQTYLDLLLQACQTAFEKVPQPPHGDLPDPITPRELEILHLICKGYSNPEIADKLVVTINTVKKHTSNIYGKLGVSSRTQAIARAHELNLL